MRQRAAVVVFPFDQFGSGGTARGAELLGDAVLEMVNDTRAEERLTRPHAYADRVSVEEHPFDTPAALATWRQTGRKVIDRHLAAGTFTVWLGGNHLSVLPVFDALGAGDLVVQFDAHLDCYALHDTAESLSHGNYLLHVEPPRPKVVVVGHRDLFLTAAEVKRTFAAAVPVEDTATAADLMRRHVAKAKRVWLDIDADVFDPAYAPGVGQPLPFGLTPREVLGLLFTAWGDKLAGISVSEFLPARDVNDRTLELLGWLVERLLLRLMEPGT
jgi:agmatinase